MYDMTTNSIKFLRHHCHKATLTFIGL